VAEEPRSSEQSGATEPTETRLMPAPAMVESLTRGEILSQVDIARRYPRSLAQFKKTALAMATLDEETAASCFYKLKRKGRDGTREIEGPSIRLAEICASAFQHVRYGGRVVEYGERDVIAMGYAHDLENNNFCGPIEVRRRIVDRDGRRYSDDMLIVTGNAAIAIAVRNALFKVVPAALVKPILDEVKKVAIGTAATLNARRQKMLDAFQKMGVTQAQILAYTERPGIEDIDLDDMADLIGAFNAVRDGDSKIEELFPPEGAEGKEEKRDLKSAARKAAESLKGRQTQPGTADMPQPTGPSQGNRPQPGAANDPRPTEPKQGDAPQLTRSSPSTADHPRPAEPAPDKPTSLSGPSHAPATSQAGSAPGNAPSQAIPEPGAATDLSVPSPTKAPPEQTPPVRGEAEAASPAQPLPGRGDVPHLTPPTLPGVDEPAPADSRRPAAPEQVKTTAPAAPPPAKMTKSELIQAIQSEAKGRVPLGDVMAYCKKNYARDMVLLNVDNLRAVLSRIREVQPGEKM
jgi:hypothetical protein